MGNKLDVWKITQGAFLIPWRDRANFGIALANPVLLLATLYIAWSYAKEHVPDWLAWGLYLMYLVLFTILATTCHRLVLLNLRNVNSFTAIHWSWRETRFLLWVVAVIIMKIYLEYILLSILFFAISLIHWSADNTIQPHYFEQGIMYFVKMIEAYFGARLCLIFPAVAVDKKVNLTWSWQLTKNYGWRLALIVGVLPWIFSWLVGLLYGENSSIFEDVLLTVLSFVLLAVEITAISISYYELTRTDKIK